MGDRRYSCRLGATSSYSPGSSYVVKRVDQRKVSSMTTSFIRFDSTFMRVVDLDKSISVSITDEYVKVSMRFVFQSLLLKNMRIHEIPNNT
jgi:hypothetical protein